MRTPFSFRFLAAIAGLVALAVLAATILGAPDPLTDSETAAGTGAAAGSGTGAAADGAVIPRRIDLVAQVIGGSIAEFEVVDGVAAVDATLVLDGPRELPIVAGTPAETYCEPRLGLGRCAVVADLIGSAVVWFALIPNTRGTTVEFPAIDTLNDGRAQLVNGWELDYQPILDRRCRDEFGELIEFESYRQFRTLFGDNFTSIYDTELQQIVAVACEVMVPYAPGAELVSTTTTTVEPLRNDPRR